VNLEELNKSVSLEGKVAIVTGASRPNGLGFAAAKALAVRGANVVVTDISQAVPEMELADWGMGSATMLEGAAAELASFGVDAIAIPVDVTRPEEISVCVNKTLEVFGGIDILINNAGVFVGAKPLADLSAKDWDISCQVHMKGIADFCMAVIPHMKTRGGGAIVNNSSIHGVAAAGGAVAYTATKYGMVGLTKSIADEFGADNIRVNVVCPGNIWTEISRREADLLADRGHAASSDDVIKKMEDECCLGRYGRPDEIGEVMAFLATPAASFITGATIRVDGGIKGYLF
jgi:3-oxoacyl-[acyl-carrier protein] reductase